MGKSEGGGQDSAREPSPKNFGLIYSLTAVYTLLVVLYAHERFLVTKT